MDDDLALTTIRLCEWGTKAIPYLPEEAQEALESAAQAWKRDNRLNVAPISFTGTAGNTLKIHAKQFVGVVEAHGYTIEIYPKLDAHLLDTDDITASETVMRNLLWMLHASGYEGIAEADNAALDETPSRFLDLFAFLFAKQLRQTLLAHGLARRYQTWEDDLPGVRGRVQIGRQVTHHWNRMDKLACTWDEFTPDAPVNRLLRCACRTLSPLVRHREASWLLSDCASLMEDVSDVSATVALRETLHLQPFDRGAWERFRRPFLLGRRLLRGFGHHLGAGSADTFVFLLNMNEVFESFARAALEARFGVTVESQKRVGTLLMRGSGGIEQRPDFLWRSEGMTWIGDAKYKHLTKGRKTALAFEDLPAEEEDGEAVSGAGRVLSPNDVRQLTVYAELHRRRENAPRGEPAALLALLYPFVGTPTVDQIPHERTWNGSTLYLVPVQVTPVSCLADALSAFG